VRAKLKRQMLRAEVRRQKPENRGQKPEDGANLQHSVPRGWFPFFVLTPMTLSQTGSSAAVRVPKVSANYNCPTWIFGPRIAP
jgi:hypothetical protein